MEDFSLDGVRDRNKPDYIGENGVKWWLCPALNDWITHKGLPPIVMGWSVLHPDGQAAYLLTYRGKVIFESPRLEEAAVHIDIIALDKVFK
jgi:hypothetical protein